MREVTIKLYPFNELGEEAQARAVEVLREKLGGEWWDQGDNDDVRDAMIYTLAEKVKTPGWDTYGVADFPGIDGVTVDGWNLDRNQALAVSGTLDRANAPALPWTTSIDHVDLSPAFGDGTRIRVETTEPDCTCPEDPAASDHLDGCPVTQHPEGEDEMKQAVQNALSEAWSAGEKEAEYKAGEENARQVAEGYEFTVDGELA